MQGGNSSITLQIFPLDVHFRAEGNIKSTKSQHFQKNGVLEIVSMSSFQGGRQHKKQQKKTFQVENQCEVNKKSTFRKSGNLKNDIIKFSEHSRCIFVENMGKKQAF